MLFDGVGVGFTDMMESGVGVRFSDMMESESKIFFRLNNPGGKFIIHWQKFRYFPKLYNYELLGMKYEYIQHNIIRYIAVCMMPFIF